MIEVRGLTKRAMLLTNAPWFGRSHPPVLHLTHEPTVLDSTQSPTAPPAWAAAFVSTSFAAMSRSMAGSAGALALSASISMNPRAAVRSSGPVLERVADRVPAVPNHRMGTAGARRDRRIHARCVVRAHQRDGERGQHLVQHGLVSLPLQHVLGRAVRPHRLPHQAKPGRTRGQLIFVEVVEGPEPRRRVRKPLPGVEPPDACRPRLRSAHAGPQARRWPRQGVPRPPDPPSRTEP